MELLREHWPYIIFSSLYSSDPREFEEQDPFLNAAAKVETDTSPEEVSQILRAVEDELEKNPPFKYGPRTIDLDVLLYDDNVIEDEDLCIPHPRMHERRFVLEPLCELIDPQKIHPTLEVSWHSLLEAVKDQTCVRMQETR